MVSSRRPQFPVTLLPGHWARSGGRNLQFPVCLFQMRVFVVQAIGHPVELVGQRAHHVVGVLFDSDGRNLVIFGNVRELTTVVMEEDWFA